MPDKVPRKKFRSAHYIATAKKSMIKIIAAVQFFLQYPRVLQP